MDFFCQPPNHIVVLFYFICLIATYVAVHLGVKMADTLSFNAKVDMVDFWV